MGFLSNLSALAKQFASGEANEGHFDQVAQNVPQQSLANGIASMMGSGGSGNFGQLASQLFNGGDATQKSGMLNTLLAGAGPGILSQFLGGNTGSALSDLLKGGQTSLTPEQAAQVPPDEVKQLAEHVHSQNGGIADQLGSFYAQHPNLVKGLGAAALGLVVNHLAETHRNA
jgi:hypothetical protein